MCFFNLLIYSILVFLPAAVVLCLLVWFLVKLLVFKGVRSIVASGDDLIFYNLITSFLLCEYL